MDRVAVLTYLYFAILAILTIVFIVLGYVAYLLTTEGPICMIDPLSYATKQGIDFIRINFTHLG